MKQFYTLIALALFCNGTFAQSAQFLNGDFENTTNVSTLINLSNAAFNGYMANTVGYGSFGNLDIITGSPYGLAQPSGTWYIAFTGGGSDAATMQLNMPLTPGNSYTFEWYDNAWSSFTSPPFMFGLTNTPGTTGTNFYMGSYTPSSSSWVLRTVTFTAPNNGSYMSVQTIPPYSTSVWTKCDKFAFSVILPVRDLTFWGDRSEGGLVELQWRTEADGDAVAFQVERSLDGNSFEHAGNGEFSHSDGEGNFYGFKEFEYTDGSLFYRLKMTDMNGEVTYSNKIEVSPINQTETLTLFPTPASRELHFNLGGSIAEGEWKAQVMSMDGRILMEQEGSGLNGTETIDVADLPSGMYLFNFILNGVGQAERFSVVH